MTTEYTVRVHFINEEEHIVPAKDIRHVGEEGARRAIALHEGKEYPIYNRPEWGFLWYEQRPANEIPLSHEQVEEMIEKYRETHPEPDC